MPKLTIERIKYKWEINVRVKGIKKLAQTFNHRH